MLKWAITCIPHPPFFLCKYSLFLLLLVHSAGSLDIQPLVALAPCSSSECYVSPTASAAASATSAASASPEAGTVESTDLIVVFKVSLKVAYICQDHAKTAASKCGRTPRRMQCLHVVSAACCLLCLKQTCSLAGHDYHRQEHLGRQ